MRRRYRTRCRGSSKILYKNSVRSTVGGSVVDGQYLATEEVAYTCSTLASFHGPPMGSSGSFGASIFRRVITQPPAPKKADLFGSQGP